jgi:hypothetical protein
MSAAHSKWPLPPIDLLILHNLPSSESEVIVKEYLAEYARAAQALAVEQDRRDIRKLMEMVRDESIQFMQSIVSGNIADDLDLDAIEKAWRGEQG